jgi:transmembrane sensor
MSRQDRSQDALESGPELTPGLIAEASAWLAILHGPNRTNDSERGFSQWLRSNPLHGRAFEEATEIWQEAGNLRSLRKSTGSDTGGERGERALRTGTLRLFEGARKPGFLVAAALVALAIGVSAYFYNPGVATAVGEQRMLTLPDGTQIVLNTNSRIKVHYSEGARNVELLRGEALFDVAKSPNRPFRVIVGDRQVNALGTSFTVHREEDLFTVTLVEGKVSVSAVGSAVTQPAAGVARQDGEIVLAPGERLSIPTHRPPRVDAPPLDKVLAWERREVALDNVALDTAVHEMNRYSPRALVISPGAPPIRVTGLFRAGDSLSFARAVAEAYNLQVTESDHEIRLEPRP